MTETLTNVNQRFVSTRPHNAATTTQGMCSFHRRLLCSDADDTCETVSPVAAVHMLRSIQAVRTVAAPTHVITRKPFDA